MSFSSFSRTAEAMSRRQKTLRLLRTTAPSRRQSQLNTEAELVWSSRMFVAGFASDYLNLDDLPSPSSTPRTRSFMSNKRSSLARRMANRELPDELADFHGLSNSTFEETLERLDRLDKIGIKPHPMTYSALLQSAGNRFQLNNGKLVHDHIMRYKFDNDQVLVSLILQMYRRCGSPKGAREWFDSREKKNMYMWTCMLSTYCQYGYRKEALEIYEMLKKEELNPEKEAFIGLASVISGAENIADARLVHEHIDRSPYKIDADVGNAVIRMYGRCKKIEDAVKMYRMLLERNSAAFNALSSAYAQNHRYADSSNMFGLMVEQDEFPDHISFSSALTACANEGNVEKGFQIHSRLPRNALETERRVTIGLIQFYGKVGHMKEAQRIFERMQRKDVIAWNTIIRSYAARGFAKNVLELFERMKKEGGIPNRVTYICALSAFGSEASLEQVREMYSQFTSSELKLDAGVAAAFIFAFGKCGSLQEAREIFHKVSEKNLAVWNSIILALKFNGLNEEALECFEKMQKEQQSIDGSTLVSALSTYGKNDIELANAVFEKLLDKNVDAWNVMIAVNVKHSQKKDALNLFKQIKQNGATPNKFTFLNVLPACTGPSDLPEVKDIHSWASESGFESDTGVLELLIKTYGKCGNVDEAQNLFDQAPTKALVLWDALILAYSYNGKDKEALQKFGEMQQAGIVPRKTSFIAVLSACKGGVSLDYGKQLHELIKEYGFEFDMGVANALIGMYARCGNLDGAIKAFENALVRNAISWTNLIAAHSCTGNEAEALNLFNKIKDDRIVCENVTYENLLSAFKQGVLDDVNRQKLLQVNDKSGVLPTAELYDCLEDLLGSSGKLDEADNFIYNTPFIPHNAVYSKLKEEEKFEFNFKLPLF